MIFSKIKKRAASLGLAFLLLTGVLTLHAFATEQSAHNRNLAGLAFEVTLAINGDTPSEDAEFTFVLEADDGAPVPSSPYAVIKGEGETSFEKIIYTEPGEYQYMISQRNDGVPNYTYDSNVYIMKVNVRYGEDGQLVATCAAYNPNRRDVKEPEIAFINLYDEPTPVPDETTTTVPTTKPTPNPNDDSTTVTKPVTTSETTTKPEETTRFFNNISIGSPKTGDDTNLIPWLVLLCVALIIIIGNIHNNKEKKRRKKNEENS